MQVKHRNGTRAETKTLKDRSIPLFDALHALITVDPHPANFAWILTFRPHGRIKAAAEQVQKFRFHHVKMNTLDRVITVGCLPRQSDIDWFLGTFRRVTERFALLDL